LKGRWCRGETHHVAVAVAFYSGDGERKRGA
jgi:hypothetical protein